MTKKPSTTRRGAAVVEFAVVAPVFILLVLGMIEVGRGINVQHVLLNAARAGCRAGIVDGATQTTVSDQVADSLAGTGISTYSVLVSPTPLSTAVAGDPVTVTITTDYSSVSWVPAPKFLGGAMIGGSCSLPRE